MDLTSPKAGDGPSQTGCKDGIVVILSAYAPSLWMFRGHLIRHLSSAGYKIIACGPAHPQAASKLAALGASFREIGPRRTSLNPVSDLLYFLRVLSICRRVRPMAVIGYTAKPVIWGGLAAYMAGVANVIAMITGLGFAFVEGPGARRSLISLVVEGLYRIALRGCQLVIFQNPDDQAEFARRKLIGGRTTSLVVRGSGVDLEEYRPMELPEQPVFLLIARMLRDKGIREFCQAAAAVKARFPEARFRLVGWFDYDNPRAITPGELESLCGAGIAEYRGAVDDVRPEIAQCRVYVLPSYREGTPRTVLEAMAMGRPVITTDVPGCRETVRSGWNGHLVPARDPLALAAAMEEFLREPALAQTMGANSRALVEAQYDARLVARSIVSGAGL